MKLICDFELQDIRVLAFFIIECIQDNSIGQFFNKTLFDFTTLL